MSLVSKQKMAWQKDELAALEHEPDVAAFVAHGRLHSNLSHRKLLLVLLAFALLIGVPSLWQAYVEHKEDDGIQIFHLFRDILETPNARAEALRNGLLKLQGDKNDETLSDLLLKARSLNRHVEIDSMDPRWKPWADLQKAKQVEDSIGVDAAIRRLQDGADLRPGILPSFSRILNGILQDNLFSREYLRAWESRTEEVSKVANATRPKLQWIRYLVFDDYGIKGVSGKDGWTFYRPGIEYSVMPLGHPTDDPFGAIVEFRDQLKSRGVELLVVVVPNKESIYPDHLIGSHAELSGKISHGPRALDSLRSLGVNVVDLFREFADFRASNPGTPLYLEDDTHWTPQGAKIAANAVAGSVRQHQWYSEPHDTIAWSTVPVPVEREGDILVMSKLVAEVHFTTQAVTCERVFRADDPEAFFQDDYRIARLLILGDSFSRIYQTDAPRSAGWISHLALALSEPLASLVSDGGASTLVREKLARKPGVLRGKKLVIWEFVERDFRFGDSGWKSVGL